MARKGEREMEARRGVQGVSSSAWLEIMKVPVGKRPLCQGGRVGDGGRKLALAWLGEGGRSSKRGWGIRRSSRRLDWVAGGKVDQDLRDRASKPQPG